MDTNIPRITRSVQRTKYETKEGEAKGRSPMLLESVPLYHSCVSLYLDVAVGGVRVLALVVALRRGRGRRLVLFRGVAEPNFAVYFSTPSGRIPIRAGAVEE